MKVKLHILLHKKKILNDEILLLFCSSLFGFRAYETINSFISYLFIYFFVIITFFLTNQMRNKSDLNLKFNMSYATKKLIKNFSINNGNWPLIELRVLWSKGFCFRTSILKNQLKYLYAPTAVFHSAKNFHIEFLYSNKGYIFLKSYVFWIQYVWIRCWMDIFSNSIVQKGFTMSYVEYRIWKK